MKRTKPNAIICDIDGVLCDSAVRFKVIDFEAYNTGDMRSFYNSLMAYNDHHIDEDLPIPLGISLLKALKSELNPDEIIYLTARGDGGRKPTVQWLQKHGLIEDDTENLVMKVDDFSGKTKFIWDHEFKKLACKKLKRKYNILLGIDDKLPNCEVFEELGFPYIHFKIPKSAI